jgi:hypothetical protein
MPSFDSERSESRIEIRSEMVCASASEVTSVKSLVLPLSQTLQVPVQANPVDLHEVPLLHQPARIISHRFVGGVPKLSGTQASGAQDLVGKGKVRPPGMRKRTRVQPPQDVVKLSERLFYLLQPDLETLLAGCRLSFPHEPFPFQFDGMAFLMPRFGGILADEMGLGKSMQAISSLRLLVHSGQVRSCLLFAQRVLFRIGHESYPCGPPSLLSE